MISGLPPEAREQIIADLGHSLDALTPDVTGMSRAEIVALAAHTFYLGAAYAYELNPPAGRSTAEQDRLFADPEWRRSMVAIFVELGELALEVGEK
jgi:hypothetical protein